MNVRQKQREDTRNRIVEAAIEAFSDYGFQAAGTRDIAQRAGVNQGLLTYHFKSKEALWREAANRIFADARAALEVEFARSADADPRTHQRNMIKAYVRFVARRPELLRFMVEEGKHPGSRMRWLVDTHLKPMYEEFGALTEDEALKPHAFYAITGASSLIFAVRPVCRRLTGLDPKSKKAIEAHAEFVADLLVP